MNIINIETVMFPEHHLEGAISYAYSKNPHLIEEDVLKAIEVLKTTSVYKLYSHSQNTFDFFVRVVTLDGIYSFEQYSDYLPLLKDLELAVIDSSSEGKHPIWYDVFDRYAAYYAGERIENTYEFKERIKEVAENRSKTYKAMVENFVPAKTTNEFNYKEIGFSTCAITEEAISKYVTLEKKHIQAYLGNVVYSINLNNRIVYIVKDGDNVVFAETKVASTVLNATEYLERLNQIDKPKFEDVEDLYESNNFDYMRIAHLLNGFKQIEYIIKKFTANS